VRRLACTAEDRNDILGDVWAEAVEWEAELVVSDDPWSLLRQCLKVPCAIRKRTWRHELALETAALETMAASPPPGELDFQYAAMLRA
jgi:hypothetical protein